MRRVRRAALPLDIERPGMPGETNAFRGAFL
jgi:hypothetical protein